MQNDPGQPKLPADLFAAVANSNFASIQKLVTWAKQHVDKDLAAEQKIRMEHQQFLLYCFLAETGLTPSKTMIVEKRNGSETTWSFAKKHPSDEYTKALLDEKDAEIRRLAGLVKYSESIVRELRDEVTHLRGKL